MEGGGEGAVGDGSVADVREGGEDGEDYDDDEEFDYCKSRITPFYERERERERELAFLLVL